MERGDRPILLNPAAAAARHRLAARWMGLGLLVLAGLPAVAAAQSSVPTAANRISFVLPGPLVSADELADTKARGLPPPSVTIQHPHAPMVQLWDEIGNPRGLPHQGSVTMTISPGFGG